MIGDASSDRMELLRRRMTNSPIYSRLTTDDEIDEVPELLENHRNIARPPPPKSLFCAKFCFFFALSGVIFLTTISHLLKTAGLYVKVGSKSEAQKIELAVNVSEASVLYIGVMILAAYKWVSGMGRAGVIDGDTSEDD